MKKIFMFLITVILIIPFVAKAETCDVDSISIESITMEEKTTNVVEVEEATSNGKKINLNVGMTEVGDSITYKIVVKNESDEDYHLDENSFNLSSEYINYTLLFEDESNVVKANSSKNVYIKMEYKNEVPSDMFEGNSYSDNKTTTMDLINGDIAPDSSIPDSPKTGLNTYNLVIVFVALICMFLYIFLRRKKYIKFMILILGTTILIPISINAVCKYEITVESNVTITNNVVVEELKIGDEVTIGTEHFYIIDMNDKKTTLFAKYNLLVGHDVSEPYEVKVYTEDDPGYGLQSSHAIGRVWYHEFKTSVVPFAGNRYWLDENDNVLDNYTANYPYIYDKTLSVIAPVFEYYEGYYSLTSPDYTIAYYVEEYVAKLKEMGAPSTTTGRLLSYEEAYALSSAETTYTIESLDTCITNGAYIIENYYNYGHDDAVYTATELCEGRTANGTSFAQLINTGLVPEEYFEMLTLKDVKGITNWATTSYWLGSAIDDYSVRSVFISGYFNTPSPNNSNGYGVRPVIEIDTSYLK